MNNGILPHILVVDDLESNLFVMKKLLSKHPAVIHTVHSGNEAIEMVKKQNFAVILLDVQMPVMDGFETATIIRQLPNGKNLPIIFLSANYKSEQSIMQGYDCGGIDYLVKPIDAAVLNKKIQNYLEMNVDVIEKKNLIHELEETKSKLLLVNEKLRDYAHLISHDMKEPIRGIFNYAEMLLNNDLNPEEVARMLRSIQSMSRRSLSLLESMLAYSQMDLIEKKLELTDLNSILEEAIAFAEPLKEQKDIRFKWEKEFPSVYIDPYLAATVFRNLVVNAVKYTGEKANTISIRYDPEQSLFSVSDTGIGIDKKSYDEIFLPLKRLHAQNEYGGGTGFGLAMVKKIVEMYGGTIWPESVVGQGTTFYFTLPVKSS